MKWLTRYAVKKKIIYETRQKYQHFFFLPINCSPKIPEHLLPSPQCTSCGYRNLDLSSPLSSVLLVCQEGRRKHTTANIGSFIAYRYVLLRHLYKSRGSFLGL